jgi:hypothetical protein
MLRTSWTAIESDYKEVHFVLLRNATECIKCADIYSNTTT